MEADTASSSAVLAHETAHVLAHRLAGEGGDAQLQSMTLFNEGLARWVQYSHEGPATRQDDQLVSAVLALRKEVHPEHLFDLPAFSRDHDESLKYPVGAALVAALVERAGRQAPAKVLAALARDDLPDGLRGFELWQAAFQRAGFDLSLVIDDTNTLVAKWAVERKAQLAALPRLRGVVLPGKKRVGVRVVHDRPLPAGWREVVNFRATAQSPSSDDSSWYPDERGWVLRLRDDVARDTVCYQLGLSSALGSILYERWQCTPIEWSDGSALRMAVEGPDAGTP